MMRYLILTALLLTTVSAPAMAEGFKYYSDPVYKKLAKEDGHPMDEMVRLAEEGDTRAMFILGDMYSKGKGGLPKDIKEARRWFEESAMHGYSHAFIRLAAMAKRAKQPLEAWQWYTLAIDEFDRGAEQDFVIQARNALIESAGLESADFNEGRKAINDWRKERSKKLREEREAQRLQQQQEEAAARMAAKEQKEADKTPKKETTNDQD